MADHDYFPPPDVLYGIFSRIPIKSLARFRCVCKLWLKIINDPHLQTIHLVTEEPTPILFQRFPRVHPFGYRQCDVSFLPVNQLGTSITKKDHPRITFYYKDGLMGGKKPALGSCNGLTLVYCDSSCGVFHLAVINPLTKQRRNLPPVDNNSPDSEDWFWLDAGGIGFDDSTNTLKTVFVAWSWKPSCVMVHCSREGSWRRLAQTPAYPITGEGVFGNGRLHWMVKDNKFEWCWPDVAKKIVWFDVKTEEFGLTETPTARHISWRRFRLVDLNGEVGFAYEGRFIELWVLKPRGEEWLPLVVFSLSPIGLYRGVEVSGCWNKDGDILLACSKGKRMFVYTLKTGDLREVKDGSDQRHHADIRVHRSSLFSIRGIETYK